MKKIIIIFMILFLMACTTIQRNYLSEVPEQDSIIMEASGLGGFVIGVLSTVVVYTVYNNIID